MLQWRSGRVAVVSVGCQLFVRWYYRLFTRTDTWGGEKERTRTWLPSDAS